MDVELIVVWDGRVVRHQPPVRVPLGRDPLAKQPWPTYTARVASFPTDWTRRETLRLRGMYAWRVLAKMLAAGEIESRQVATSRRGRPRYEYRKVTR